jgi:hypothetical protein
MAELSNALNDSAGMDEDQLKEIMNQISAFPSVYDSEILFASNFDDEDEDEDEDEFEEEDEDLFDEDELEEEGYEEDFDFDEDEDEEEEDEDVGTYN